MQAIIINTHGASVALKRQDAILCVLERLSDKYSKLI
jgi:hypothetical protein